MSSSDKINYMSNTQKLSAEVLCSGMVAIAQEKCPSLLPEVTEAYTYV